ncbi:unnamed protein product [Leuciscus chuanchicus]
MAGIIPKHKIKGVDFCGSRSYCYIIRSDLGCYMRSSDFNTGSDLSIHALHPCCQHGDHYFADEKTLILQSSPFIPTVGAETITYALYYWGDLEHFYFLKPASDWGVEYYKGGLSITNGPAFGKWVNIKTVTNDSPTPVTWQKKITKKFGYNKEKMSQITRNWEIAESASISAGNLAGLIAKCQFSFSAEYGGASVNAKKENWNEVTELEEQRSFELKPYERLYVWQFQLGLGSEPVLFCRDLKISDKPDPPLKSRKCFKKMP